MGMASVLPIPSGTIKHAFRMHRLVILPDYQGLGIGTKINDFIANLYLSSGKKFYIRTSHIRLIQHLRESNYWLESSSSGRASSENGGEMKMNYDTKRVCCSFEYIGKDYAKPLLNYCIDKFDVKYINDVKKDVEKLSENYRVIVNCGIASQDNEIDEMCSRLGISCQPLYFKTEGKYEIRESLTKEGLHSYVDEDSDIRDYNEKLKYQKQNIFDLL